MPEGDTILRAASRIRPGAWAVHPHSARRRPCPHCGTPIAACGQGDEHRTTSWCPGCQR